MKKLVAVMMVVAMLVSCTAYAEDAHLITTTANAVGNWMRGAWTDASGWCCEAYSDSVEWISTDFCNWAVNLWRQVW